MRAEHAVGLLGLVLLIVGNAAGLFYAPPERMMGDVGRILYVHVPAAWLALVTFTLGFAAALGHLLTGRRSFDQYTEATTEVGILLTSLLILLGSIFARPTWGVWWNWDPRLTACAIMLLTYVGVMLLRSAVTDPERRATWTSVTTILAYVNIPITYYSVKWWRSLHQIQSSPETMNETMVWVLRTNAFAFLFLTLWFIAIRRRIALARDLADAPPPLETP